MIRHFSLLVFLCATACASTASKSAVEFQHNKTYKYRSLIYSWASQSFIRTGPHSDGTWGELHSAGSDAIPYIESCADGPRDFCIKVLGAFQFSYSCDTIGPGREWRKGDWVYTAGTEYMGEREYMIAAKGKVFRREYEDAHWHFVFSEEKGVVGIVGLEPRGDGGQLVAHVALRAEDEGFGQLAEVCRE